MKCELICSCGAPIELKQFHTTENKFTGYCCSCDKYFALDTSFKTAKNKFTPEQIANIQEKLWGLRPGRAR